jgi:MFS transporter, DHA2 family, methylenomycin A resistance protein
MRSTSLKFPLPRDASTSSEDKPVRSRLATSLTLAAMSLGYGVVQLDVTIVNTALNSIGASLGGGVSELQWVVSAYTIAFAAFILTAGALAIASGPSGSSWRALQSSRRRRSLARFRPMPRS